MESGDAGADAAGDASASLQLTAALTAHNLQFGFEQGHTFIHLMMSITTNFNQTTVSVDFDLNSHMKFW